MTLQYSLDENDLLQARLYAASKNKRIKKRRRRNWILMTFGYLLWGCLFWSFYKRFSKNEFLHIACAFFILAILVAIFYPFYQRYYYKRFYKKRIIKKTKNKSESPSTYTFNDDFIGVKDDVAEAKMKLSNFEKISETENYFYLKIKNSSYFVTPKAKIPSVDEVRNKLSAIAQQFNIPYVSDLNWKWK